MKINLNKAAFSTTTSKPQSVSPSSGTTPDSKSVRDIYNMVGQTNSAPQANAMATSLTPIEPRRLTTGFHYPSINSGPTNSVDPNASANDDGVPMKVWLGATAGGLAGVIILAGTAAFIVRFISLRNQAKRRQADGDVELAVRTTNSDRDLAPPATE